MTDTTQKTGLSALKPERWPPCLAHWLRPPSPVKPSQCKHNRAEPNWASANMRRRWWFQQLLLRKVSCSQSFSTFIMTAFFLKEQNKDLQTLRDSSEKKGLHPILPPPHPFTPDWLEFSSTMLQMRAGGRQTFLFLWRTFEIAHHNMLSANVPLGKIVARVSTKLFDSSIVPPLQQPTQQHKLSAEWRNFGQVKGRWLITCPKISSFFQKVKT